MKKRIEVEDCPCINCLCVPICKQFHYFSRLLSKCELLLHYYRGGTDPPSSDFNARFDTAMDVLRPINANRTYHHRGIKKHNEN